MTFKDVDGRRLTVDRSGRGLMDDGFSAMQN
jgi:hypothetical protein